jgi:murein DD-endopeptidase MepM/ murein hydrolase activator NlpD
LSDLCYTDETTGERFINFYSQIADEIQKAAEWTVEDENRLIEEIKEDADTNKEIETIYSNETKIPEITEIEYPKFPVDGEILKSHSANTPVYSSTMNDWRIHEGIDILCDIGEKVHASASGKVVDIYEDYALGLTVLIEHNGYSTKYCNLSKVEGLSVGDSVKQGEIIAIVGDSAKYEISDKPHLHFEILEYGKSVDPYLYIK